MERKYGDAENRRAEKEMCAINACIKYKDNAQLLLHFLLRHFEKNKFKPNVY